MENIDKLTKAQIIEKYKALLEDKPQKESKHVVPPSKNLDDMIVIEYDKWRIDNFEAALKIARDPTAIQEYGRLLHRQRIKFINDFQTTEKIDIKVVDPFRALYNKTIKLVTKRKEEIKKQKLEKLTEQLVQ